MSLRKRTDSFRFALMGLADLWRSQPNARIHAFAAVVVTLAGFFFKISALEWVAVVLCIAMVVAAEAMNTALEYLTDLVSPDFHPLAGKAKDASAAAVLVLAVGAAIVGGLIFFPKIWLYLTQ